MEVIGTIPANQWNGLYPSTKRIIRTVVMDTDHWTDEAVLEYIDIANQESHPHLIGFSIRHKLGEARWLSTRIALIHRRRIVFQ